MATRGHKYGGSRVSGHARAHFGDVIHNYSVHKEYYKLDPQEAFDILFESLAYERMDARFRNIAAPLPDTCHWVRNTKEFRAWIGSACARDHNGILWIKGKPGSGKSTIMRQLVTWAQDYWNTAVIVLYFFNARAPEELEKSPLGLYRSLVYQFLVEIESMRPLFVKMFEQKIARSRVTEDWTEIELRNFLQRALPRADRDIAFFIDALDEGKENDIRAMLQFFEQLADRILSKRKGFNLCIASRHYPKITIVKGLFMMIDDQHGHAADIATFIDKTLHKRVRKEFKATILRRSDHVFLWVILVIPMLNRACDQGKSVSVLKSQLNAIPQDLHDLFKSILQRNMEDMQECVYLLRWVLCARRPLHPVELFDLLLHKSAAFGWMEFLRDYSKDSKLPESSYISDLWTVADKAISDCILDRSRGLLEITGGLPPQVQFIHETARSTLMGMQLPLVQAQLREDPFETSALIFDTSRCHEVVTSDCVEYLIQSDSRTKRQAETDFHLTSYACRNWFLHLELCSSAPSKYILDLIAWFLVFSPSNRTTRQPIWGHHSKCGVPKSAVFYAVLFKIPSLVRRVIELGETVDAPDVEQFDPLEFAAEHGQFEIVEILLAAGADPTRCGGSDGSAILAAASSGHTRIVRVLAESGADVVGSLDDYRGGPLLAACDEGHLNTMNYILTEMKHRGFSRSMLAKTLSMSIKTAYEQRLYSLAVHLEQCFEQIFGTPEPIRLPISITNEHDILRCIFIEISDLSHGSHLLGRILSEWPYQISTSRDPCLYAYHRNGYSSMLDMYRTLRQQGIGDMTKITLKITPAREGD